VELTVFIGVNMTLLRAQMQRIGLPCCILPISGAVVGTLVLCVVAVYLVQ
jgi:hypothetical protein